MTALLKNKPLPLTYKELWLPEAINTDVTLPIAAPGGHALTMTAAARKGTTCDGVHFTGGATSNVVIADNAIQDGKQAFHITIRFKLDNTFDATAGSDLVLFKKTEGVNIWMKLFLQAADGRLHWDQRNNVGMIFQLASLVTNTWAPGVWHTVTAEFTSTPTQRLLVNGVLEDSGVAAAALTQASGDMIIGNSSDGGVDGFIGTISLAVIGVGATATVALTAAEEGYLVAGLPPATAKVQYMLLFDEGRGTTVYDRGAAGGNGTMDAACTWKWGLVKQPCLSLNALGSYGISSAGLDISGALTIAWVAKMKSTYAATAIDRELIELFISNTEQYTIYYNLLTNDVDFQKICGGGSDKVSYAYTPAIDDYAIIIATASAAGVLNLFVNGALVGTVTYAPAMPATAATAYIGAEDSPANYDISKPLFAAVISGALTVAQAKEYAKFLNSRFGLGLTI